MAKRFTDTNKYKKPFIRKLPGAYKLFWDFLYHDCDHAGVWIVDFEIAHLYIGKDMDFNKDTALSLFNTDETRIIEIDGGEKWFIPSFIMFQYGKQLVSKNRMHVPIINMLDKYNLFDYVDIDVVEEGNSIGAYRGRITKKVKEEILLRDNFKCQYCSKQYEFAELVVDHIKPLDKGGDNANENLCACCVRCNSRKTNLDLNDFLSRNHDFLNPTEFIQKKSLEAPYKELLGVKDKEQYKEQDKDKNKEEAKFSENLIQQEALIPALLKIWKEKNPTYFEDKEKDFQALRKISLDIATILQVDVNTLFQNKVSQDVIKLRWGELVTFIHEENFFRNYSLYQVEKHFQSILLKKENGNSKTFKPKNGKSAGAYELLDQLKESVGIK